jgi:DNA-binding transcriptional regulator YdaS (Cro superfamily)
VTALKRAIEIAGSAKALAKKLNVTQMTISYWIHRSHGIVPPQRVIPIYKVTGVTPHELRPDLYPNPKDGLLEV